MNRSEITELLLKCIGPQLDVITARLQLNQNILPAREQPNATRASAILVLVNQQDLYDQLGAILSEMFPRRSPAKKAQPSKPKKPRQSKSKEKQPKERCILILAANPVETDRLSIDKEVRLIKEKLREGDAGRQFRVESEWAVRYDDVSKFLLRYEPAIVHFSGHGSPTGRIILEDERGEAYPLSVEALARLLDILRGPTECIVLNACYSNAQARALSQIVGRVVGMEKEIGDVSALNFAGGFYLGLAYGKDYETAFKLGCNAIDMASLPDATLPHLTTREKDQVAEISYSDYGQAVVVTSPTRTWVDKGAASQPGGPLPPKLYPVWFGTSRSPVDPDDPSQGFTGVREPERVHYGLCKVAVPKSHKFGSTGSIWWKRLLTLTDDRLKLKELSALEEMAFWDAVRRASAEWDVGKRSALVFIHGFGVSFNEAAIRAAQIGFDLKFPGVVAFFSWPSKGRVGLLSYKADEASVEANERQISDFLVGFARQSGADHVNVMAHSMGNRGLLRAMQRIVKAAAVGADKPFRNIIFAAPDVDADVFRELAQAHRQLTDRATLYLSSRDRAVKSSALMHDYPRAGFIPPVTIIDGIDSIEVSNADLTLLGHSYYGAAEGVLYDMHELLLHDTEPDARLKLVEEASPNGKYWKIGV